MSPALSVPPVLLFAVAALAAAAELECPTKCGDVDITYPFGIGPGCYRSKGFEISCVNNGTTAVPVLPSATHTIPVTSLSVAPQPVAKVMLPVAYQCYNSTGGIVSTFNGSVDVNKHGVYRISDARNMFVVLGCNTGAYTQNSESDGSGRYDHQYYMGCFTYCSGPGSAMDGRCASVGCCHVEIPPGLTDNAVSFESWWPHDGMDYSPCDIAFLVANDSYKFRASDLRMDVNRSSMPVWLDWAIRDDTAVSCAMAKNSTRYACVSANSECVDTVSVPGYFCRCKQGFEGNPYKDKNGCTNIDECTRPEVYPCYGVCMDTEGSYECKCPSGYTTTTGDPKTQRCSPKFPLEAQLALGIPLGISLLGVALLCTLMVRHKRRMNGLFKKNGGSVLQKVDNIKIFTKEELKKITKNNSHVLGKGGSGHVHKGTLEDSTLVAVKASIEVSEARKEDFTNEVIIQSQMIHKNIIKLLGCCLEVDIPMLVYEFAPNGSLHDVLHGDVNRELHLSLDIRLDIATESAEGLKYMHSSTNHTIRHGDVKSANILLDENFMPKISDFGTSKLLTRGEDFTMFVIGSMGYIDPVFHQTGLLTRKSDVYSFGVVLLELICRKPPIYDEHCSLINEFHRAHEKNLSSLEKFSGPVINQSISRETGIDARRRTASVRRNLHFELEEHGVQGNHSSPANSHHNNYEKPIHSQSSLCSVTESEVQTGRGLQVDMENSSGSLALGMSLKLNELLDEYIHLPEVTPKPTQQDSNATSGCFRRELAMEHDNVGQSHQPDVTSKSGLCIEESAGISIIEGNNKDLELNYSNTDGFLCSATSLTEMESTRSQMSMASKFENHTHNNDGELSLTGTRDSIILRTAAEMVALCQAGGIKKKRSARFRRNSFVSIMDLENNTLEASTRLPQACMDALYESSYIRFMTKKRSQKVRPHCPSSNQPNAELKNRLSDGSIFYSGSNASKISEETSQKYSPQTMENKRINLDSHYEVPEQSSANTSTIPYMDYLQGVASKLKHLDLNTEHVHRTEMRLSLTTPGVISFGGTDGLSNALVPYGGKVVVPYERPLQLVKRQRPRAKVDLDFETSRVWNLLMGKAAEPVDGTDVEKESWWQQEREVFQGRANSFIARMRLVQGDRRFSPWKGSVVDSVVGVFLTQNVADHLSSSAFMALAASFPSQAVSSNCKDCTTTQDNEQTIRTSALEEKNVFNLFHYGARPDLGVSCEELWMTYEKIHMEPKDNACADELIKVENYSFDRRSANASVCNSQGTGIEHKAQQFPYVSTTELTASAEVLKQIQFQKEISSSQSVTLGNLQSRLSLSSGIPRNFACGDSAAACQQLGSNMDHGKSLTGNGATTSEMECQRPKTAAISDDGTAKPVIPCNNTMPFISTIDPQQQDLSNEPNVSSTSPNSSSGSASPNLKNGTIEKKNTLFMPFDSDVAEMSGANLNSPKTSTELPVKLHHDKRTSLGPSDFQKHESLFVTGEKIAETIRKEDECTLKSGFTSYNGVPDTAAQASLPKKTRTTSKKNMENFDWDKLRRRACSEGHMKERSFERKDSVDWDAVRCADVQKISHAIRERGMNNVLAERIQSFLNRLVRDHGSIDLEWLRDIPPDSAKDYLLSIRGLGLKSVECVRLLTLHHLAFPVDTNVGRICVRLGWVPIQPLPESLQLHLLELYPVLETIQKYLWPRLCKLDQETLYELHYHMITFGKVFCTKSKPNCNACPMRSECKHFASAFASARLALPAPQEKSLVKSSNQFAFQNSGTHTPNSTHLPRLEGSTHGSDFLPKNSEPIIEEPESPREKECPETMENDIEDFYEDGEIPTIRLNMEAFAQNLQNCIKESNTELQSDDIAKALVAISTEAASIPVPKLKNVHRLRTEHYVYELPDSLPLVQKLGLDQREPDDPSPYLLAIWTPGEMKEITKAPKPCCDPQMQMEGGLCSNEICHNCIAEREDQYRYVRGTILVPCRTAMRGSFPLNGTYFQVNEVFADHKSSHNPIHVERGQLWNLQRRVVFFGTSVSTIFKGLTTEEIQQCFWRGFVCVRGFDMETKAPRPLCPHLHAVARPRTRKTAATEQAL